MAKDLDPYKLSSPAVYLWRMLLFLVIAVLLGSLLYQQIQVAFGANPALNGTILLTACVGILLTFRQVVRLFPEVRWVNDFRLADPGLQVNRPPVLLAPMATLLGDRLGRMAISTQTMRSILDSIATRLDEARDISRYLTGLLVFLGLLGTFWGLIQTVTSVGATIQQLDVGSGNSGVIFEDLKAGLQAPLAGMGTAFSSSLFGLAGSLVLGFLDLQAGQAQNRFYIDLEDWLSTVTDLDPSEITRTGRGGTSAEDINIALERLTRIVTEGQQRPASSQAMSGLAEGIQGLVQHMRAEQQLVRKWAEEQGKQQADIKRLLEALTSAVERSKD
ncbi:flagellar motor protein MotA [Methylobrevis albus]|uniref:Flagellar motor protein MotA n=1 Tax=Methylobrevis albus TaxID=2793297 RepID=A0A931I3W3_9HYPH|nr:flagellar motor protein MotA [Methylobrevis albus]MBH0239397.1 flagellar motor protein MotA [Methylobrevis albus]